MAITRNRESAPPTRKRKPIYHHLYFWVLVSIIAGALLVQPW